MCGTTFKMCIALTLKQNENVKFKQKQYLVLLMCSSCLIGCFPHVIIQHFEPYAFFRFTSDITSI